MAPLQRFSKTKAACDLRFERNVHLSSDASAGGAGRGGWGGGHSAQVVVFFTARLTTFTTGAFKRFKVKTI